MMRSEFQLSHAFVRRHPEAAARVLERLSVDMAAGFLAEVKVQLALPLLAAMVTPVAARCLAAMPVEQAAMLLESSDSDVAATLLRAMPNESAMACLARLPASKRNRLARMMNYPEGSVGSRMLSQLFVLPTTISVAEALKRVRQAHQLRQHHLYVSDDKLRLAGALSLDVLLRADGRLPVAQLPIRKLPTMPVRASVKEVADMAVWIHHQYLPVVDSKGRLVGELNFARLYEDEAVSAAAAASGAPSFLEWLWLSLAVSMTALLDILFDSRRPKRNINEHGV